VNQRQCRQARQTDLRERIRKLKMRTRRTAGEVEEQIAERHEQEASPDSMSEKLHHRMASTRAGPSGQRRRYSGDESKARLQGVRQAKSMHTVLRHAEPAQD
jgi:hypothetical protein